MTPARRAVLPTLLLLAAAGLASACGGSASRTGVATGPSQSPGPVTTPPATAAASASPTASALPTPTPAPSPTPAPTSGGTIPASDPDGATKVGEYLYPAETGIACGARTGHYDACPVTSRLASRLDQHPTEHAEPLCRCQNLWQQAAVSATQTPDATVWIDHVVLTFGPGIRVAIDLRVLQTSGGWLADDTTCTGQGETTSIYVQNPPPCPG